ncbi:MAG: AMP-binding protein, partial [Alphaproteobacteria bacterium]
MAPDDLKLEERRADSPETGPALLRGWLAAAAEAYPEKPYLVSVEDGRTLSYGELARLAARIAGHLAARGIGPNDRVVLLANN